MVGTPYGVNSANGFTNASGSTYRRSSSCKSRSCCNWDFVNAALAAFTRANPPGPFDDDDDRPCRDDDHSNSAAESSLGESGFFLACPPVSACSLLLERLYPISSGVGVLSSRKRTFRCTWVWAASTTKPPIQPPPAPYPPLLMRPPPTKSCRPSSRGRTARLRVLVGTIAAKDRRCRCVILLVL